MDYTELPEIETLISAVKACAERAEAQIDPDTAWTWARTARELANAARTISGH